MNIVAKYKGNERMYEITDESANVIILYENATDTISISSIANITNYYVILYYKRVIKHLMEHLWIFPQIWAIYTIWIHYYSVIIN